LRVATITIRTDPAVDEALDALTGADQSRSEVIREAILLAFREQRHARLRAEAEALRNDPDDVAAARELAAEMESVRAW
jgi:Arc/MetJ-type ribon-helix-helix transcriptional regulator